MYLRVLFTVLLVVSTTVNASKLVAKTKQQFVSKTVRSIRGGHMSAGVVTTELRTPPNMFSNAAAVGTTKGNMIPLKIFLLGIMSGCHIALGTLVMIAVGGICLPSVDPSLKKIICGTFGPPLGLFMTVVGGGELFLGNCCIVSAAVMNRSITKRQAFKNLFFCYMGNFIGSLLVAYLAFNGKVLGDGAGVINAAILKTGLPFNVAFIRAILCNWLVCMGVYMASGATSLTGKMTAVFFPISAMAALSLEHSVANMFLIPLGMMFGAKVSILDYLVKNLLPVTLGNLIGGVGGVSLGYALGYGPLLDSKLNIPTPAPTSPPSDFQTIPAITNLVTGDKHEALDSVKIGDLVRQSKAFELLGGYSKFRTTFASRIGNAYSYLKAKVIKQSPSQLLSVAETGLGTTASPEIVPVATGSSFLPSDTLERAKVGNNVEKIKQKKDPTAAWNDVYEYAAAIRSGSLNWEDISSEDMDFRVKYSGMFHRKKATPGRFMMRLRIPNGIVTSDHMRYFSSVVSKYGPDIGVIDITTRMNIQLRSPPLEDCADIITGLQARGLTCLMSGLDNLRNMVGSPIAGLDPLEDFDTRALAKEIDSWYSNNGQGNPEWANMPRKFNIAISGSRDDFSHTLINDIGLQACPHAVTKQMGFNIVLGGYISIKRAAEAIPMNVWVPVEDAMYLCRAILRLFRDYGARGDRQKARLMWLIEEKTVNTFKDMVATEMATYKGLSSFKFEVAQKHSSEWTIGHRDIIGVHPQKQDGYSWVGVHVPVGRLSAEEANEIADVADKYSNKEVRLTVDQNIILPNVANDMIDALLSEPIFTRPGSRLSVSPGHLVGHVVSCTGSQFCPLAMVETKLPIARIIRKLDDLVEVNRPVRIHMTGCPNSCGQVQVADIGLMGAPARKADAAGVLKAVPGVNIYVGGHIGENASLQMKPSIEAIPFDEESLLPHLTKILVEQFGGKLK